MASLERFTQEKNSGSPCLVNFISAARVSSLPPRLPPHLASLSCGLLLFLFLSWLRVHAPAACSPVRSPGIQDWVLSGFFFFTSLVCGLAFPPPIGCTGWIAILLGSFQRMFQRSPGAHGPHRGCCGQGSVQNSGQVECAPCETQKR